MASRRRNARIVVMQTLFEMDFPETKEKREGGNVLTRNIAEHGGENVDIAFAHELLEKILGNVDFMIKAIQDHAPQWPMERMDRISRAILMIGACELLLGDDAPPAVVMDEAIEIAKEYGEEESTKFVNGVLNAIAHAS